MAATPFIGAAEWIHDPPNGKRQRRAKGLPCLPVGEPAALAIRKATPLAGARSHSTRWRSQLPHPLVLAATPLAGARSHSTRLRSQLPHSLALIAPHSLALAATLPGATRAPAGRRANTGTRESEKGAPERAPLKSGFEWPERRISNPSRRRPEASASFPSSPGSR